LFFESHVAAASASVTGWQVYGKCVLKDVYLVESIENTDEWQEYAYKD
jgi:hypothetical protein